MRYLADACALLAFFGAGDSPMTRTGVSIMQGEVWVSPVTVWELTRKASIGKLPKLPAPTGSFAGYLAQLGFRFQGLSWEDAERANQLPAHHKDPMDRMLIATALGSDMTVITDDSWFAIYGVRTIW
ncbi:MAG TPA: type II toxin-antitoxin system VapC family toxin [Acetobacteraceae bacterium]|nr:type II toxin-antitoxin system VapC family toxin [Acetobacteraceae bacterium]